MVSLKAVRTTASVVCVAGIAGMIVTSILNHNGAAVTFGLITAVAVLCTMVAKAVAADTTRRLTEGGAGSGTGAGAPAPGATAAPGATQGATAGAAQPDTEALAELVEGQVQAIVATGADEATLRQLVGEAVRLGRNLGAASPVPGG